MAATATGTAKRRTLSLPTKPAKREVKRHDAPVKASETIWVHALQDAIGFHRDALLVELAVGLSLFAVKANAEKVELTAKKALREIYERAGYACKTQIGEDYKTVQRRIGVTADFYAHLGGRETINDWIEDAQATKQIARIVEHLKEYNFTGVNSVLAYIGKAVAVKRIKSDEKQEAPVETPAAPPAVAEQMSEEDKLIAAEIDQSIQKAVEAPVAAQATLPPGRVFTHGSMTVSVPFEATYDDVMSVVHDLMEFARQHLMHQGEPVHH